ALAAVCNVVRYGAGPEDGSLHGPVQPVHCHSAGCGGRRARDSVESALRRPTDLCVGPRRWVLCRGGTAYFAGAPHDCLTMSRVLSVLASAGSPLIWLSTVSTNTSPARRVSWAIVVSGGLVKVAAG